MQGTVHAGSKRCCHTPEFGVQHFAGGHLNRNQAQLHISGTRSAGQCRSWLHEYQQGQGRPDCFVACYTMEAQWQRLVLWSSISLASTWSDEQCPDLRLHDSHQVRVQPCRRPLPNATLTAQLAHLQDVPRLCLTHPCNTPPGERTI